MYDNIDFVLHNDSKPGQDFLREVPGHLSNITSTGITQRGEFVNGYLKNLKVSIAGHRVKISDGSLCKYYLGDNFKTLSRGDVKRAIESISDTLHLPLNLAVITRIDAAKNIILKYPEKIYYPYLGEAQYYTRLEQNNGLYYNNSIRQMVFYGKVYEQKHKREIIPEPYKNRNVLRYEIRFIRQLSKQLNLHEITAQMLYDEAFYNSIATRWKKEFLSIQKINTKLEIMKPTGSKKEFAENLALISIIDMGQAKVLNLVKEWQERGEISKKQAYDLRLFVKEISQQNTTGNTNDLILELTQKINEAACY